MSDSSAVFDEAIEEVLLSDEWPYVEKIIFIAGCMRVLYKRGWTSVHESKYWSFVEVQAAYDRLVKDTSVA